MRRPRAFVLILAIFFLALIELMAICVTLRIPQGVRGAARYDEDQAGRLVAEAGIQETLAYLEKRLEAGTEPLDPGSSELKRQGELNGFRWEVLVEPDEQTYPRGNHSCRCYTLTASVARPGKSLRPLSRLAVTQEPFTKYARFSDKWSNTDPVYYWAGRIRVDGPVHSNGELWIQAEPSFYSGAEEYQRLFNTNLVSCVDGPRYAPGAVVPSSDAQRRMLFNQTATSKSPRIVAPIPLPSLTQLGPLAFGGSAPHDFKLHVSEGNGVYVAGPLQELEFSRPAPGQSRQRYRVQGQDHIVTEDLASGRASWTEPNGTRHEFQRLNGLIYVDGPVEACSGAHAGNHTVALKESENLVLTGSLTSPAGHQLGLVVNHLQLPPASVLTRDFSNPTRLDAALYCVGADREGGVQVDDMLNGGLGTLQIHGCLVVGRHRRCADTTVHQGWNVQVSYNADLRQNPPPFFPTLPRLTPTARTSP